ncbi:MdtA/MuxA family multidrug efflux RND transporter periplasmic adaptor subunit [Pseudomonas sp. NW5]|uniref:MdtA/MuxA family multidrug efflux RND transporter periplasmic adaptor subunit n=1 Tax=Pseudomonas sp. NW5 TaxID=2934934 RepID=UPI0020227188|nr:MdtA/MuxA family multidrug efflux RND transporter periplasmic adaptor subunit [Pseudomonas sp. NW5]MCL7463149.1 MdtA/MuxA family multidrug efflux RND transporter periplasmic adaptor subunit [Pseudomonas sp. NW5]
MPEAPLSSRSLSSRWSMAAALVVLAGALTWWFWPASDGPAEGAAARGGSGSLTSPPGGRPGGGFRGMGMGGAVPVRLAEVERSAFALERRALGTVQALSSVSVRPQVEGELLEVLFEEGAEVKAGQLLARIDPRSYAAALAQAEGNLQERRAELRNAELDLRRYEGLYAEDSIARQTLDSQQARVEQLRGSLRSLQAQVDEARLRLEFTELRAPLAGRLGLRQIDAGNLVSAGESSTLVTITQTRPISVNFTLPEAELAAVLARYRSGQPLTVQAWDRNERTPLAEGVLASIDNQIDTRTGTVRLKARFANDDERLFPNQFVNVRLRVDTLEQVLLVPSAAVQFGNAGTFVYVVDAENQVSLRPVQVAVAEGERSVIASGLEAGERVVIEGTDRLREGSRVEVVEGAFKPAAAAAAPAPGSGSGEGAASGRAAGKAVPRRKPE